MKKFFQEFAKFIKRGNVIDLAIGIIIGGAFQKIVSSLVNDIVMPVISVIGGVNVSEAKWVLKEAVTDGAGAIIQSEIALKYGNFIQVIIDFLIIAFAVFIAIKIINRLGTGFAKAKSNIESLLKEKTAVKTESEAKGEADNTAVTKTEVAGQTKAEETDKK